MSLDRTRSLLAPLEDLAERDSRIHSLLVRLMPQEDEDLIWVILEVQFARDVTGRIRDGFLEDEGDIAKTIGRWLLEWVSVGVLPKDPWRDVARGLADAGRTRRRYDGP